ncbi:MAG: RluA family pseudouridine synthase [Gammaproteobacteria bacterium]|nr:RluA family pseudouridine synthase [Gammaproteobacteria bacterium]
MSNSFVYIERHLQIDQPLDGPLELLAQSSGLSKQKLKQAMQKGAVWLTRRQQLKRLRRVDTALQPGDMLHLYYDERTLATEPPPPTLLSDDRSYSAWYKPPGLLSQGTKWGDHCAINRWVEAHLQPRRPTFVVHRLDRDASGLMLLAHTPALAASLSKLFHERTMAKHYRVIVQGRFPDTPQPQLIEQALDGRDARSRVTLLSYQASSQRSLLDVGIETGRKHQIRRHLASLGFPVVGDRIYGTPTDGETLRLTAASLSFRCPVTKKDRQLKVPEELLPTL